MVFFLSFHYIKKQKKAKKQRNIGLVWFGLALFTICYDGYPWQWGSCLYIYGRNWFSQSHAQSLLKPRSCPAAIILKGSSLLSNTELLAFSFHPCCLKRVNMCYLPVLCVAWAQMLPGYKHNIPIHSWWSQEISTAPLCSLPTLLTFFFFSVYFFWISTVTI